MLPKAGPGRILDPDLGLPAGLLRGVDPIPPVAPGPVPPARGDDLSFSGGTDLPDRDLLVPVSEGVTPIGRDPGHRDPGQGEDPAMWADGFLREHGPLEADGPPRAVEVPWEGLGLIDLVLVVPGPPLGAAAGAVDPQPPHLRETRRDPTRKFSGLKNGITPSGTGSTRKSCR